MVETALVEKDLEEGRRLIDALKESKPGWASFRVRAAFWQYRNDWDEWRLVIATPLLEEKGRLATYAHLRRVLGSIKAELPPQKISIVSPHDPLVTAFRGALRVAPNPKGVRFTKSMVGDTYVEDAYLYRLV